MKKKKNNLTGKMGDPDRVVGHWDFSMVGRGEDGKVYKLKKKLPVYRLEGPMPKSPEYAIWLKRVEARRQAEKRKRKAG